MANNRLWIKNTETGEKLLLAKSFGHGWKLWDDAKGLAEWLDTADFGASFGNCSAPSVLVLVTENEENTGADRP